MLNQQDRRLQDDTSELRRRSVDGVTSYFNTGFVAVVHSTHRGDLDALHRAENARHTSLRDPHCAACGVWRARTLEVAVHGADGPAA